MTTLDSEIFSDDRSTAGSFNLASLYTENVLKKGEYAIKYRVYHSDPAYAANVVTLAGAFVVTIADPCDAPVSVTASPLTAQEYTITDNPLIFQIPPFAADPVWCEIVYSYSITDISGDACVSFNADPSLLQFTLTYHADLNLSGPTSQNY